MLASITKFLIALAVLLIPTAARAQVNPFTTGAGAPSGSCTASQVYLDTTGHNLYICSSGTWTNVGQGNLSGGSVSLPTTLSAPGVFTNTQQNDTWTVGLNSINFANEFQIGLVGFSGWNITEAMAGGCAAPSSSTVLWCTGLTGYANTDATTTEAIGVSGFGRTLIAGGKAWGGNLASTDCTAVSGATCTSNVAAGEIIGLEADADIANASSPAIGVNAGGTFLVQPTSAIAFNASLGATNKWTTIFNCANGVLLGSEECLHLGYLNGSGASQSTYIGFHSTPDGTTDKIFSLDASSANALELAATGGFLTRLTLSGAAANTSTLGFSGPVAPPHFTVSTLPSASTAGTGATVIVTDASTFTVGTCTGGGSDFMIAISNGTTWSCH